MLPRRTLLSLSALSALSTACEAIGMKATIVTTKTQNGQTTTRVREAKNWDEFEQAMGEVATDFSDFAKQVGATTVELAKKLVDVPPQGQVTLGQLSASLKPYEGDVRYDYLKVARMNPDAKYDSVVRLDATQIRPHVTWGTSPEMVVAIDERVPDPDKEKDAVRREGMERALQYMGLKPNTPMDQIAIDKVFIGS
mgnify:CR=1 FL=1